MLKFRIQRIAFAIDTLALFPNYCNTIRISVNFIFFVCIVYLIILSLCLIILSMEKNNILSIEHLTKSFTGRLVFDDTSFYLHEGEKVGVIGINGTGKSTLLKIIANIEEPDNGTVTIGSNLVVRYLPQNPEFIPDETMLEGVIRMATSYGNTGAHSNDSAYSDFALESDAKSLMTKLGLTDFNKKCGELSGGQRKRLALVGTIIATSDILLLDEPTNHLDSEMSSFLEERLRNYRGTLVLITHDRYFLDSVCNRIVELDKGKLYSYTGGYSKFLELKVEREEYMLAAERKRQSILRKDLAWIQRGARARSTKQKAHIQRYEALRDMDAPVFDSHVEMSSVTTRMGKTTVELIDISKRYGELCLIDNFTYRFLKNDRIGFIGPNGSGKTTLMKMIVGEIKPDSGEIVIGQTVKLGYYTQEIANDPASGIAYMDPKLRVIDYIKNTAENVMTTDGMVSASNMLERFLFTAEQQYSPISKLSGGEKRRLNLLRVLMEAPNVLILDEPTNDLDIATLQILEDYLDSFQGIVITVSHDRYFLDRVVRRIFAFTGNGQLRQHEGGYTDYENRLREEGLLPTDVTASASYGKKDSSPKEAASSDSSDKSASLQTWKQNKQEKLKFSYKEQREYETIEDDIAALEEKLANVDTEMSLNSTNSVKLSELTQKQAELNTQLEEKMERWEYLMDLAAKIEAQNSHQ